MTTVQGWDYIQWGTDPRGRSTWADSSLPSGVLDPALVSVWNLYGRSDPDVLSSSTLKEFLCPEDRDFLSVLTLVPPTPPVFFSSSLSVSTGPSECLPQPITSFTRIKEGWGSRLRRFLEGCSGRCLLSHLKVFESTLAL